MQVNSSLMFSKIFFIIYLIFLYNTSKYDKEIFTNKYLDDDHLFDILGKTPRSILD